MIRPCDDCDGGGVLFDHYDNNGNPQGVACPRCYRMPLLQCSGLPGICELVEYEDGGYWCATHEFNERGFRPETDTVMQVCVEHNRVAVRGRCPSAGYMVPCRLVWIEKPTPLEVVNERSA